MTNCTVEVSRGSGSLHSGEGGGGGGDRARGRQDSGRLHSLLSSSLSLPSISLIHLSQLPLAEARGGKFGGRGPNVAASVRRSFNLVGSEMKEDCTQPSEQSRKQRKLEHTAQKIPRVPFYDASRPPLSCVSVEYGLIMSVCRRKRDRAAAVAVQYRGWQILWQGSSCRVATVTVAANTRP